MDLKICLIIKNLNQNYLKSIIIILIFKMISFQILQNLIKIFKMNYFLVHKNKELV